MRKKPHRLFAFLKIDCPFVDFHLISKIFEDPFVRTSKQERTDKINIDILYLRARIEKTEL